ncbi:DMT family transporter [Patescibacteria group bacterium]|nr:DMT family transporter [Patescibacteria group bacterium]MBU1500933.1 DMT family transporter [Patescibacteria group bacterium]MBU2080564.1 DMT family transporter [Patescibacteria group bacterium]MBU2124360.1 DMT family transporter [Patescibacteria group bacterium]MBU2194487.1 DMT family transporter [Patescibacteria group bacterium]
MTWFLISLIGPFLYAMTNFIDKTLLEKYFKHGGVGTLLIFSALLSALALPILFLFDNTVFSVGLLNILVLATVGVLNVLVLFFYLKALEDEEASVTVVFYQLVPVFAYGLAFFILGETLTTLQLIAMAIVIFGTSIISFEVDTENNFKLRTKTIFYMVGASFCWALGSVIFKAVALEEQVVRSLFWEHLVLTVIGIGLFFFVRSYREHFIVAVRDNSKAIFSLNVLNETLYMLGNVIFSFAYLLGPIAVILLAESFQPLFAILIGVFMTVFFPRIITEKIHIKHLWQKGIAFAVTCLGTYLLLAF